jgi:hypothetical protein
MYIDEGTNKPYKNQNQIKIIDVNKTRWLFLQTKLFLHFIFFQIDIFITESNPSKS